MPSELICNTKLGEPMTRLRCAKCGAFVSSVKQRLFEEASSGIYIRCRKCKAILDATQYSLLRYWNYTKSLGVYWLKHAKAGN